MGGGEYAEKKGSLPVENAAGAGAARRYTSRMILTSASPVGYSLVVLALMAYAVMGLSARWGTALTRSALLLAWAAHGATIAWGLWSGETRFGFAAALSITAWLVLTVYAYELQWFPQMRMRRVLAWMGAAAAARCSSSASSDRYAAASDFSSASCTTAR